MYERLSTTERYNLERQHPYNLASSRTELEDKYGSQVRDLFEDDEKGFFFSSGDGLSMAPLTDLAQFLMWAYSTPKKAIVTSTAIFLGGIHFGWITLPVVVIKGLGWAGIGMMTVSSCLFGKEIVVKIKSKKNSVIN